MQDDSTFSPAREKRPAKSCCLLALAIGIACVLLISSGIACIIIADSINLRGEEYTFSRRVERYKVACQFLWFDFKDWISRAFSDPPPSGRETVQCPADPPESEQEPEAER